MNDINAFLNWLERLNRGAMADLRRSLSYPLGQYYSVCKYVEPFLGANTRESTRQSMYLLAGLYALHQKPSNDDRDNLGRALARVRRLNPERTSGVERRFLILLSSRDEQFTYYLRRSVETAENQPLHYPRLYFDLLGWENPGQFVQTRWVRAFYSEEPVEDVTRA